MAARSSKGKTNAKWTSSDKYKAGFDRIFSRKDFQCSECGGTSPGSNECANHSCPNMPCCDKSRDKCDCFPGYGDNETVDFNPKGIPIGEEK